MAEGRVTINAKVDKKTYEAIKAIAARRGISMSDLIRQALDEHLKAEIAYDKIREIPYLMNEIRDILARLLDRMKDFTAAATRLRRIEEEREDVLKALVFFSAVTMELIKARIFRTLSSEEFEKYKAVWDRLHEVADRRVEKLMGERVWNRKFDPTVMEEP